MAPARPNPQSQAEDHSWSGFSKDAHRDNFRLAQMAMADEFQLLIHDTEQLLQHTQGLAGDQVEALRHKLDANLQRARQMLDAQQDQAQAQYQDLLARTEQYVQEKPLKSLGIAAGIGLVIGLLSRR